MIRTERLRLRRWQPDDLEPMHLLNSSPEEMRHFPALLSREETAAWIRRCEESHERDGFGFCAVERLDTNEVIGACGLFRVSFEAPFTPAVEIGWRLRKPHWGQGFATEAARATLEFGWAKGLSEIVALTVPANLPSQRVMERLGMKRDLSGDFLHPRVPAGHPLQPHWLWRITRPN